MQAVRDRRDTATICELASVGLSDGSALVIWSGRLPSGALMITLSMARADPAGQWSTDPGLFVPANELPAVRALVTSATAAMDKLEAGLPGPVILGSIARLGILASAMPSKRFSLSVRSAGLTRHVTVPVVDLPVLWNALREACDHLAGVAAMAQARGRRAN